MRPVNVFLKEEIRRQPLRLRRKDVALAIDELETTDRRRPIVVQHAELHGDGWLHGEEHGRLGAKPEILRSLSRIEGDRGLPAPRFARVHQRDRVLDLEPTQSRGHGCGGEHLHVEKTIRPLLDVLVHPQVLLLHPLAGER